LFIENGDVLVKLFTASSEEFQGLGRADNARVAFQCGVDLIELRCTEQEIVDLSQLLLGGQQG